MSYNRSGKKIVFNLFRTSFLKHWMLAMFALHLFSVHSVLHSYVLCFGDDGHITLENGSCVSENKNCESESIKNHAQETNYGCKDISLSYLCDYNTFLANNINNIPVPALSVPAVNRVSSPVFYNLLTNLYNNSSPLLNIPLLSFNTVSLLI